MQCLAVKPNQGSVNQRALRVCASPRNTVYALFSWTVHNMNILKESTCRTLTGAGGPRPICRQPLATRRLPELVRLGMRDIDEERGKGYFSSSFYLSLSLFSNHPRTAAIRSQYQSSLKFDPDT